MFLIFIISLAVIVYFICLEMDNPVPSRKPLTGACPNCLEQVESGWLVCPHCRTIMREPCHGCGKVHDSWASYCPWCGQLNQTATS